MKESFGTIGGMDHNESGRSRPWHKSDRFPNRLFEGDTHDRTQWPLVDASDSDLCLHRPQRWEGKEASPPMD